MNMRLRVNYIRMIKKVKSMITFQKIKKVQYVVIQLCLNSTFKASKRVLKFFQLSLFLNIFEIFRGLFLLYVLSMFFNNKRILHFKIRAGSCTSELQLEVNCRKKFGQACQLLANPGQILSNTVHFRSTILFQLQFTCT